MSKKVLFIANVDESKALPSYIQDFRDKGNTVKICRISGMFPRWHLFVRMKRRIGLDLRSNVKARKKKLESQIMRAVNTFQPDIVCEINGMMLNAHCADEIRKHSFLAAKMIDRISFFPEYYEKDFSKHYDVIYTYALDDYKLIQSVSNNCVYIPSMCEDRIYHDDHLERDIDVSFVGKMYPEKDYGDRYTMLRSLVTECPELNFYIGGECAPIRRPKKFVEWVGNPLVKKSFVNKQISAEECNRIYNRSKISISMERNGTGNSWSGRLVNLFGTRTFVLASDESEMLTQYFTGCYVHFDGYQDLKEKVLYYLAHPGERNKIAERAYERVQELKTDPININMTDDIIRRFERR